MSGDDMMMLNEITGLVHEYEGAGLGRPLNCGCDLGDDELDNLVMIHREHMERGIWQPAPCVESESSDREVLEAHLEEKMDHGCYDDASWSWMGNGEMYVYLPREGICTTTVENRKIPDPWSIQTVWCKDEETVVSITKEDT